MSDQPFVLPELTPEQIAELKQRWEAMYGHLPERRGQIIGHWDGCECAACLAARIKEAEAERLVRRAETNLN